MTNSDKTFWRHMHQKTPYEFNTGNGQLFPFSFVSVIFYKEGDGFIIHADNAVIADGNPMGKSYGYTFQGNQSQTAHR